jgi:hypothetical protein
LSSQALCAPAGGRATILAVSMPPGEQRDLVDLMAAFAKFEHEVRRALAHAGIEFPAPPTVPPMREEQGSSHDWAQFADKAVEAVRSGLARDDTTPEEQIRKLVQEEAERREAAKEIARLRKDEENRIAAAAETRAARKKMISSVIKTVVGGSLTAGAIELARFLSTLHH